MDRSFPELTHTHHVALYHTVCTRRCHRPCLHKENQVLILGWGDIPERAGRDLVRRMQGLRERLDYNWNKCMIECEGGSVQH